MMPIETQNENHIPFTNQQYVIENILKSHPNPRYIIDAPAGCGKTELLKELKRRFLKSDLGTNFRCAYILVTNPLMDLFINEIFREFDFDIPQASEVKYLCESLAKRIIKCQKDNDINGFILLIDLDKNIPEEFLKNLVKVIIPRIQNALDTVESFKDDSKFRVVITGRHLAGKDLFIYPEPPDYRKPSYHPFNLRPFSFKHLYDTAKVYLSGRAQGTIKEIATDIYYLSGGHLRCIAKLLQLYKQSEVLIPETVKEIKNYEIKEIILKEKDGLINSIPENLKEIMEYIGCFRFLNYDILEYLLDKFKFSGFRNTDDLRDVLIQTRNLQRKKSLLINHNQKILALGVRENLTILKIAQEACIDYLTNPRINNIRDPERWAIEYLYLYLQSKFSMVDDKSKRNDIREEFFNNKICYVIDILLMHERKVTAQDVMLEMLDEDEDLKFIINYSFRKKQYNNNPYLAFKEKVVTCFNDR